MTANKERQGPSVKREGMLSQIAALNAQIRNGTSVSKKSVDEFAQTFPQTPEWWRKLLPLYDGIKAQDRLERVSEQILEVCPGDVSTRVELIRLLIRNKDTIQLDGDYQRSATSHLKKLIQLTALSGEDWIKIADCATSLRDYNSAATAAQRGVDLLQGEDRLRARLLLVQAALGNNDRAKARRELHSFRVSLRFESVVKAAVLYERAGANRDALMMAQLALKLPTSPTVSPLFYLDLVQLFMKIDRANDAKVLMEQVGLVNVSYFDIAKRFSDVCFNLTLDDLSRLYAQKALSFSPYDPLTKARLEVLRLTRVSEKSHSSTRKSLGITKRLAAFMFIKNSS
jgi:hypothetical protein